MFAKRSSDNVDWYVYLKGTELSASTVKATALQDASGNWVMQAITRDATTLFPVGCKLLELFGVDAAIVSDADLRAAFGQRNKHYDPVTHTLIDPSAPVPETITDRQFFQAIAMQGLITQAASLDAVKTGAVPPAMQPFIDALPVDQQFGATMLISGAVSFQRHHPLVVGFGTANGMTSSQIDDLWRFAATL